MLPEQAVISHNFGPPDRNHTKDLDRKTNMHGIKRGQNCAMSFSTLKVLKHKRRIAFFIHVCCSDYRICVYIIRSTNQK